MTVMIARSWWRMVLMETVVMIVGCLIVRPILTFFCRLRVRRASGLPRGRAYVIACNHRSFSDPPLAGILHYAPVAYFARASLWNSAFPRFFLTLVYGIPVERENATLSSIRGAVDHLRAGVPVLVFPEGTRTQTGRLQPLREGPVVFARRAKVPIVPMYVHKTDVLMPRGRLLPNFAFKDMEVRIGRPIEAIPGLGEKAQARLMLKRLQWWMQRQERELLGPEKNRS